ncbi:MAG: hypothetical protein R2853_14795 [Thermomicrobiales bacterium]
MQEATRQTELVEKFQRGGVNGIASEVAPEIPVFLPEQDIEPGSSQEQAQHRPGGVPPQ